MDSLVLAIDQGTTGTTALVVTPRGEVLGRVTREFPQHFPSPGWVEHDPEEIWQSVLDAVARVLEAVPGAREKLVALGLTNQRETLLVVDAASGVPVHRALVWQDRRTSGVCEELRRGGYAERVNEVTGLVLDPYFSATKLAWLLDSDPTLRRRAESGDVHFANIDGFLLRRLTGDPTPRIEVTNASRTLLLDLETREFSAEMCELFRVPRAVLPHIVPSVAHFGTTLGVPGLPDGLPITGIAGDQHAALFGQGCVEVGQAKCTYGTGAFVLVNTGSVRLRSRAGLLTTLAWQIGEQPVYALEGACFIAGAAVQWLRDGLGIIADSSEIEALARTVSSSDGVHFVPALSGLGAPYWDADARGLISGLTRGTTRAHLARATLEAIAFEVEDLLEAMDRDLRASGQSALAKLRVDGGAARNDLLLQLQADFSQVEVDRPLDVESTGRGAALLAALGVGLHGNVTDVAAALALERTFRPEISGEERATRKSGYRAAVARSRSNLGDAR